jgi:hypothetical protein
MMIKIILLAMLISAIAAVAHVPEWPVIAKRKNS